MKAARLHAFKLGLAVVALALLITPVHAQATPEAAKVRVLLVLDTLDSMGATWGLDGENMKALIEQMVRKQGLEGRVVIDHFIGDKVTPKSVLDYYNQLDVGPDDALVFYFSGHGAFHKPKGHFMAFTRGHLFRNDLLAAMDKKKPRLRVVLTDCCANYVSGNVRLDDAPFGYHQVITGNLPPADDGSGRRPPVVNNDKPSKKNTEPDSVEQPLPDGTVIKDAYEKARKEEPKFEVTRGVEIRTTKGKMSWETIMDKTDGKILRDLLFRHVGLVDINGCKLGQLSMGTYEWGGSVFTNAFILLLTEPTAKYMAPDAGQVTWEGFYPHWQRYTDEIARAYTNKQASQQPHAWKLGAMK